MSSEGLNECPIESLNANEDSEKRQVVLTAKAYAHKIEGIQKERQTKVNKLKSIVKLIKGLMQDKKEQNIQTIQSHLENCDALFKDANQLHNTVMPMLPQEEQDKQSAWFTSIHAHKVSFIDEVTKWLSDVKAQASGDSDHTESSLTDAPLSEKAHVVENPTPDVHLTEYNQHAGNTDTTADSAKQLDDEIKPSDSASNLSGKSRRSPTLSTCSARIKAEAEMAALKVRQRMLKSKHALEEEEQLLRKRKEQ